MFSLRLKPFLGVEPGTDDIMLRIILFGVEASPMQNRDDDSASRRDGAAKSLDNLFTLKTPREDAPLTLPEPAVSGYVHKEDKPGSVAFILAEFMAALSAVIRPMEIDPSLRGFHHVALQRDLQTSPEDQKEEIGRRFLSHKAYHATRYMRRIKRKTNARKANA